MHQATGILGWGKSAARVAAAAGSGTLPSCFPLDQLCSVPWGERGVPAKGKQTRLRVGMLGQLCGAEQTASPSPQQRTGPGFTAGRSPTPCTGPSPPPFAVCAQPRGGGGVSHWTPTDRCLTDTGRGAGSPSSRSATERGWQAWQLGAPPLRTPPQEFI